jgi:spermidine synthase
VLPLIFHALRERVANLGDVAGRLYSWNTLGSLFGALLGGYALLFWLDLHHTYRIAMATIAVAAALATASSLDTGRAAPAVLLVTTLGAIALLPSWEPQRLAIGLFRNRRPFADTFKGPQAFYRSFSFGKQLFYDDDPVASIAVSEFGGVKGPSSLAILSNGKSDSAIPGDNVTTGLLALIPALFGPEPARAFVIGYGTGVTAGELAALESTREVTVAEIAPGVIEAAPIFDPRNLGASRNPKVRVVRGDAYRTLLRSSGQFDLILSEPSNPWVTGIEMLYSREFLEAARDRLTPGGVHAQWFHSYESDTETIAMVLRTYASVFPHSSLWFTIGSDLLLIGFQDPARSLDLARVRERFARPGFRAAFRRCKMDSLTSLLAHELLPVGVLAAMPLPGPLHELLHPRLSYLAARAFFAGKFGDMPLTPSPAVVAIGQRNSLLRRHAGRPGGGFDDAAYLQVAEEVCGVGTDTCLTWMARWTLDVPVSPGRDKLEQTIRKNTKLAAFLRTDQVPNVMALYDDGPPLADEVTPERATQASKQYRRFYHYAVPFSREALAEVWRRCEAKAEQQKSCYAARLKAERELGDLGV